MERVGSEQRLWSATALLLAFSACDVESRTFGVEDAGVAAAAANGGAGGGLGIEAPDAGGAGAKAPGSFAGANGQTAGQGGLPGTSDGGGTDGVGGAEGNAGAESSGGQGGGPGGPDVVPGCGNGLVEPGEDCDAGSANSNTDAGVCNTSCRVNECAPGATRTCAEDGALGNCAGGTQDCEDGAWGACDVEATEQDACTDADDANCNGTPNEGCLCIAGNTRSCATGGAMGNCASGVLTCSEQGEFGACSIQPADADSCDDLGDDATCNGTPNEGCTCTDEGAEQPCGPGTDEGVCGFGVSTCEGGVWSACQGAVFPAARDCTSSADNDCDGEPDNTIDGTCQCVVGTTESCDEHPGFDGNGLCQAGTRTCNAGADAATSSFGACQGAVGPSAASDSCAVDGADSDCNGVENEGCACLGGDVTTCADEYGYRGDCGDYQLTCGQDGNWPSQNVGCQPSGGDTCAAPGECLGAVWDDADSTWNNVCWQ